MSSRIQLTPAELDRLEDALEGLEDMDLSALSDDDPVDVHLAEYREILQLSRDAMPMQEVPVGVLDAVLAEARAAATVAAPVAKAAGASWWSRWRVWVPGLAFAGSAALLLLMLWPQDSEAPTSATIAQGDGSAPQGNAKADPAATEPERTGILDDRLADASLRKEESAADDPFAEGDAQRGAGMAIGEREPPADAMPVEPEPEPEEAPSYEDVAEKKLELELDKAGRKTTSTAKPKPAPKKAARNSGAKPSSGAGGGGSIPGGVLGGVPSQPAPAPEPSKDAKGDDGGGSKSKGGETLWDVVYEGDRLRRGGNCGLANMRYDKARKTENREIRARALAGRGLCEARAGNATAANKLFDQAKAADPKVASFIAKELDPAWLEDPPMADEDVAQQRE